MSRKLHNPRSALHALAPLGRGTPDVESLLSYFCRLAVSHSVSVAALARMVAEAANHELREGFDWHERNLSGCGASAETWASALSALTSVGHLDRLTLVAWRDVIAQSGLAAAGGRWCPDCFADDRSSGKPPYFRLAWDIGAVTVCQRHRTPLADVCPDCGRTGIRHKATYVVPGWCTHCGAFLGTRGATPPQPASPETLWVARQVGLLLAAQDALTVAPTRERLHDAIRTLVTRLDHGKSAVFARRIGLGKATVHNWLRTGGIPMLGASLRMALHAGLSLPTFLAGDLDGWEPPQASVQMDLGLVVSGAQRETPRELDWDLLRAQLVEFASLLTPISLAEAARRLEVDTRHLYLQANKEARILGERWRLYVKRRGEATRAKARQCIENACRALIAEGRAITLREVEERVPHDILATVERLFDMLQDIKEELGVS